MRAQEERCASDAYGSRMHEAQYQHMVIWYRSSMIFALFTSGLLRVHLKQDQLAGLGPRVLNLQYIPSLGRTDEQRISFAQSDFLSATSNLDHWSFLAVLGRGFGSEPRRLGEVGIHDLPACFARLDGEESVCELLFRRKDRRKGVEWCVDWARGGSWDGIFSLVLDAWATDRRYDMCELVDLFVVCKMARGCQLGPKSGEKVRLTECSTLVVGRACSASPKLAESGCRHCTTLVEVRGRMDDSRIIRVVLGVSDTSSTDSVLNVPPFHRLDIAHAVLVAELARDDVREDFRFAVLVRGEAGRGLSGIRQLCIGVLGIDSPLLDPH